MTSRPSIWCRSCFNGILRNAFRRRLRCRAHSSQRRNRPHCWLARSWTRCRTGTMILTVRQVARIRTQIPFLQEHRASALMTMCKSRPHASAAAIADQSFANEIRTKRSGEAPPIKFAIGHRTLGTHCAYGAGVKSTAVHCLKTMYMGKCVGAANTASLSWVGHT